MRKTFDEAMKIMKAAFDEQEVKSAAAAMKKVPGSNLADMPNVDCPTFKLYREIPAGYECKLASPYGVHRFYNPTTKHVLVYAYHETTGYGESSTDIVYNGHYDVSDQYFAEDGNAQEEGIVKTAGKN